MSVNKHGYTAKGARVLGGLRGQSVALAAGVDSPIGVFPMNETRAAAPVTDTLRIDTLGGGLMQATAIRIYPHDNAISLRLGMPVPVGNTQDAAILKADEYHEFNLGSRVNTLHLLSSVVTSVELTWLQGG